MEGTDRIVLVDGYAFIYRSFFAIRDLSNARGEPTNALYGMARFLHKLEQDFPHSWGAVVLDKGRPAKRLELLPGYKSSRPPMPDALRQQLPKIQQWVQAAGWPVLEQDGHEADDLIAGIAEKHGEYPLYIVSHDKDLAQIVRDDIQLVMPGKKGSYEVIDEHGVQEKFGVPPRAIPDYLALVGDSVDDIPGIAGIGPKTATELLAEFGSVEAIMANTDRIGKEGVREKLQSAGPALTRNRQVALLDVTLPEQWQWQGLNSLRRQEPDWETLLDIARDNNFKSLITALHKAKHDAENPTLF